MLNLTFVNGQTPALNARNMNAIVESINTMQTQLANPFTYKGVKATVANLPSSGNTINDTWYVTSEGCLYSWNGTAWGVSSLSESDYLTILQQVLSDIAHTYDSAATYTVGDYCIYNNTLYRCNTAITAAEAWTEGHWTATSIGADIGTALVGYDGTVYPTLGEAVRGQVGDLAGAVTVTEHYDDTWAVGTINSSTGAASSATTTIRSGYYNISEAPIRLAANEGYTFLVFGYAESTYLGYWRNGSWSKASGAPSYYVSQFNLSLIRDTGATRYRLTMKRTDGADMTADENSNLAKVLSLPKQNQEELEGLGALETTVSQLQNALTYEQVIGNFVKGKYITTNVAVGGTVDVNTPGTSATISYRVVPCEAGDRFLLSGTGFDGPRLWAFTDTAYGLISKSAASVTMANLTLTAEQDGYLIVNIMNTRAYSLARLVEYDSIADDVQGLMDDVKREGSNITPLVRAQKAISDDWHFSFINVYENMGLGNNHTIPGTKTLWSSSGQTDLTQKNIWMQDGTHPFKGSGVTEMYARTIAPQLAMVVPSYREGVGETSPSVWAGRRILWMGTSIPAGSDPEAGEGTGSTYPALVASMLGATTINRSRGSSCVRINSSTGEYTGMIFPHFIRALTRTVAECDILASDWDNIKSKISLAPDTLSEANVSTMKAHSFENLVLPYLNGTQSMPDLFVIDHGHNDVRPRGVNGENDLWIEPSLEMINEGILAEDTYMTENNYANLKTALNDDLSGISNLEMFSATLNRNCFKGAVNFLITVILRYNPYARVAIISDYN